MNPIYFANEPYIVFQATFHQFLYGLTLSCEL